MPPLPVVKGGLEVLWLGGMEVEGGEGVFVFVGVGVGVVGVVVGGGDAREVG